MRKIYTYDGEVAFAPPVGKIQYKTGEGQDASSEWVEIFLPSINDEYVKYSFVHTVLSEKNANIWRIAYANEVNSNMVTGMAITTTGEWECAIKIYGRSDFSGGFLHGDEVMTNITFLIDDEEITDMSAISSLTEFVNLTILQSSVLYDPNDSTTVIANHYSEHIFKPDGTVYINQTVEWLGNYTLGSSYLAMFPISKDVSEKYYTNYDFVMDNIVIPIQKTNVSKVTLTGENLLSSFWVDEYPKDKQNLKLMILDNGGGVYNKCYYVAAENNDTVVNGDVWKSESRYRISLT